MTSLTKTLLRVCACAVFTVTLTLEAADATIYYVATNGNDSNPGTDSQPLRTIARGVRMLSAGDTLYVKGGTYSESIRHWQVPVPNGTSWSNPITIAANPGDTVVIKPWTDNAFVWIGDGQSKYLIIRGFIIDGGNTALHGFKFEGGTKYVRVRDCEVKNAKNSGILVTGGSSSSPHNTHHEFINLKVHHNGSSGHDHGFYIETSNNVVANSQFYNNKGNGGKFYHGNATGVANNNIARNNRFYNNSTAGIWSCGLLLSSGNGNQAFNNVAYGNFAGFCVKERVTNARLYNNIAYENNVHGIYVGQSTTSGTRVENNTVFNSGTYGIFVGDNATTTTVRNNITRSNNINLGLTNATSSHNLTVDPLFVNASAKDFRLQSNSPAINKGTSISGITFDHANNSRPQGGQFDIGAYEYQGSGSTDSTSDTNTSSSSGGSTTSSSSFPASLVSPSPGATLTSSTVTFTGGHTSQDTGHWIYVGSSPGGSQYYGGGLDANHQVTVSGLPTSGTIYVRYLSRNSSGWDSHTHSYTMSVGSTSSGSTSSSGSTTSSSSYPPPLVSPSPGATLTSSTVTFTGGHTSQDFQHWVQVGSTPGGSQFYAGTVDGNHQITVSGLPSTGTIYVRYNTRTSSSSSWDSHTHSYTMSVGGSATSTSFSSSTTSSSSFPPPLVSPSPGATLTSSTVTFTGGHTSQDFQHWVQVGSSPGGSQYYAGTVNANHQITVSGLPSRGTIYVRYNTRASSSSSWESHTHSYTMSVR